jgi:Bacterial pullanase-associated domain
MTRRLVLTSLAALWLAAGIQAPVAAQAPEVAKLPDGMVAIHYHRPAGDYDGWGLHLWESFDKIEGNKIVGPKSKSDQPLPNVTWTAPMKPTGKDGFGVYFHVKADEFRNSKVNYILHKGDVKDQCGKDIFFDARQLKQVFVNQGDCDFYTSLDDAMKARKK